MKKTLVLLLALSLLALSLPAFGEEAAKDTVFSHGWTYRLLDNGTAEVLDLVRRETDLVIPEEIDGIQVTAIGKNAFSNQDKLLTVQIPGTVTSIGEKAFAFCVWLDNVVIPEGVTSLGSHAFNCCYGLKTVTFPDSLSSVGDNPFSFCRNFSEIRLSPEHPYLEVADGALYSTADRRLICCPPSLESDSFTVKDGTEIIGKNAFDECENVREILLPDSVTVIGSSAFASTGITGIALPAGVTAIPDAAFAFSGLTAIEIPATVTSIGRDAFDGCSGLAEITLPDTVTEIGDNPFSGCDALEAIRVSPDHPTLEVIGGVLFSKPDKRLVTYPYATEETAYAVPEGTEIIGTGAFDECESLEEITFPSTLTAIGDAAFGSCTGLTAVVLPESVTSIGDYAFAYCDCLRSVTLPAGSVTISAKAFTGCPYLTFTVAPDSPAVAYCEENNLPFVLRGNE